MAVLINFKICDNSKDCSGITICPVGAFYWDEGKRTIAVDNKNCISCGRCEKACPVGAIRVARTEEEYRRIKKEIDEDPRKVSDLFVDRYGAEPLDPAFLIPKAKFSVQILEATQVAVVEFFSHDSIRCMLYSIPIKELLEGYKVKYRKIKVKEGEPILKKYQVTRLPSMVFFKDGGLRAKIEGYYEQNQKNALLQKIKKIMNQIYQDEKN